MGKSAEGGQTAMHDKALLIQRFFHILEDYLSETMFFQHFN